MYHADLNINNILFDDSGNVFIIDFDRGEIKTPDKKWQQSNMSRLQRSFLKEQSRNSSFHWQENDWQSLNKHYHNGLT